MPVNWSLPLGEKLYPEGYKILEIDEYKRMHESTVKNYKEFWAGIANEIPWYGQWKETLDDSKPPFYRWFVGGELNASYLCVDRHAKGALRDKVALIWEGEPQENGIPTERKKLTYGDLYTEVNRVAYMLKNSYGLKRGDIIGIYMPMIPELPIVMLAASRIGVAFSVIFSGFGAESITERMDDAGVKLIVTADGGWRAGKIVPLKQTVDEALKEAAVSGKVLVVKRAGNEVSMTPQRDRWYHEVMAEVPQNAYVEPERMRSEDPLYVLYTSGTTGKPKGQVHDTGGYMVLLHATMNWVFDVKPEDVYWCTADIGWVTGHSYMVYGPLMEGLTEIMYEGSPSYPGPDRWASVIERNRVTILYTSPTAIRGWMRFGDGSVNGHDLSSLRLINSVGEPLNPEAFRWFYRIAGRERIPFSSTWWMTETGGIMISHIPGKAMIPMKPGTNGLPIFGIDAEVLDDKGSPQQAEERGYLVIKKPWPGMPLTIYKNPDKYREVYFSKFPGLYYAGDYAVRDRDGYFWILGRADEVIKVAEHRLGTYELESAIVQHKDVAEAAVVGVPDAIKGEVPVAFVILKAGAEPTEDLRMSINSLVRDKIGRIASLKQVYFVTRLPKTRSAKIMRRVIRAVLVGTPVGDVTTIEDGASLDEIKNAYSELQRELKDES
ncbi:MAG: acetate--CoA ligase [Candidatus Micrarchaeota archaeon]|nr:acetate--CoA ligase [Candidatus Micrarchaeota archaeon]